jgi:hypothetical protein
MTSRTRLIALSLVLLVGVVGFSAVMMRRASASKRPAAVMVPTVKTVCATGTPDFTTLSAAITDLNTNFPAGNVTYNVCAGFTETAPAGGYVITATGSSGNDITIQKDPSIVGANPLITAGLQLAGGAISSFDAVFKIHGGDFVTIQGFTMQENVGNVVLTPGITNTMTEFGVLLVHSTATNGAQNNTIKDNIITLNSAYTNSVGIFSTSSSDPANATLDATSTAGTNSNNKIHGNTISNVAYGIEFICPPVTATVFETGNDFGGVSAGTGNAITFGNAVAQSGAWNRSTSTNQAGILYRNGAGNSIRFNTITSNSAAYVGSAGLNGIQISSGTAPTGVTYTSTISDNTVSITTTGVALATGVDFGHGVSTGTIVGSTNNVTVNQTSSAANSAVAIGIKSNYTSATNTANGNTVVVNQSSSAGALSGASTGITLAGTATTTMTANTNNITLNVAGSGTGTITGAQTALSVAGTSTVNTANSNTILFNQTTSVATGITTGAITGIVATSAASTSLNIGSTNQITVKQAVTGAGTYGTNAVSYLSVNAAHNNVNITGNTFNTTASTIRSTGACDVILGGASTLTGTLTITGNTVNIDRVAISGAVGFYTQTSTTPNDPTDIISSNVITFTSLAGTSTATVINRLGGATAGSRTVSSNTISVSGTNTGTVIGIISGFCSTATMNGNSVTISSAGATVTGITTNGNTTTAAISNTSLSLTSSVTAPTAMTGISVAGSGGHSITGTSVSAMNFTAIIGGTPSVSGIVVSAGSTVNISGNNIGNVSVGAATSTASPIVDGILISGGTTVNTFKNKIHGLTTGGTGTTTILSGIRISGSTTLTVFNNLIGTFTAPAAASTDAIRGINITSTTTSSTRNVFYNTVFLNASSTGANFGTTGIFHTASATSTTSALNLRNNLIINTSTPNGTGLTVAYRRSVGTAGTLANYAASSNNNDFYAGTPGLTRLIYSDGTSTAQTIAIYKTGVFTAGTIAPRDSASISENPTFLSTSGASATFLHIDATVATQIESGGAPIGGITDDFDGDLRHPSTPDIGADEFAGIAIDLNPPVITYTPFTNTTLTANRTLSVTITDATGVASGALAPRIYYRRSGDISYVSTQCGAPTGNVYPCTIDYSLLTPPTASVGDVIQYFVVAQDTVTPTPNISANPSAGFAATDVNTVTTPPTTPNSYSIVTAFPTSVNVGTGETYTSLSNNDAAGLFKAMNAGILPGNVTVNVTTDLITESGVVGLAQQTEEGVGAGTFTVTIKSSGGPRLITGTATATTVIAILGADRVTIDGDDPSTGPVDRGITISTINTVSGTGPIFIGSPGAGVGNVDDTIKNCIIQAQSIGSSTVFTFGIFIGNASGAAAGADNDSLTIQNNQIRRARTGIQMVGDATGVSDNLQIIDNLVGDPVSANSLGRSGIVAQTAINNASISRNTVQNITLTTETVSPAGISIAMTNSTISQNTVTGVAATSSSLVPAGIVGFTSSNVSITQNTVDGITSSSSVGPEGIIASTGFINSSITRNNVKNISYTGTSGYGGKGIEANTGSATSSLTIANNFVSNIKGDAWSAGANINDTMMGIRVIGATGGVNIYHNSVNMGSGIFAGNSQPVTVSAALYVASTATALNVRDNILVNNLDNATITGDKNYAFYSDAPASAFTNIDFNDYWVPVSSPTGPQVLGFIGSDRLALTDIQTGTTKDANSKNFNPAFASAIDLHLTAEIGQGVLLAGIVDNDFDNDLRDTVPDIGADEIVSGRSGTVIPGTYRDGVMGSAGLAGNTTFTGSLTLTGIVDANNFTLTSDCGGTVTGGGPGSFVANGSVKKNFCVGAPFVFPVGTVSGYSPLDTDVTAVFSPNSSLTVRVDAGTAPASPPLNSTTTLQRYWTLTEGGSIQANLVFHYLDPTDIMGNESAYEVIKIEVNTAVHIPFPNAVVSPAANTAAVNNIQSFSKWTLGEPLAPTSIEANIGGHVVTNTGQPLSGVQMSMVDTSNGSTRSSMTDANGDYGFGAVLTGRDILVTPQRQGYTFNPASQVFSHTGERLNVNFIATPDSTTTRAVVNDFDGDGKTDLAVFRPSDASWYILPSSTGVMRTMQWGLSTDRIVPADYDGDHKTDIAVFRPSTGDWHIFQSSTETVRSTHWGVAEDIVAPADYDGDGKADLAVFRPSTGIWYVLESLSGQMRAVNWGLAEDKPVAADYDNDGKADIAVFRPSSGIWYIINSTTGEFRSTNWGLASDRPVVGDYDGDGRADVAVFRPSDSYWYVLMSADNSVSSRAHGTSIDIPAPGDYDGDGKLDRAVWQHADGNWLILRSTTNVSSGHLWGTNGDIPVSSAYVR